MPTTVGEASVTMMAQSDSPEFDRWNTEDREFSRAQTIVDSWAENDATDAFDRELATMSVDGVAALMRSCDTVAAEHDRRATRARNVRAQVQAFLLRVADVPPGEVEYVGARENVKSNPYRPGPSGNAVAP